MKTQMCLKWKDIEYTVPVKSKKGWKFWKWQKKKETLQILHKSNGCVNTGDLIAVLGSSGAGKTTLLAAISQRIRGDIKGDIYMNGIYIDRDEMTKISSFLPQFEITVKSLTAYEHLYFMSHFKMDKSSTKQEKIQKVESLLCQVGLRDSAQTRITNLSGGERKRLSLAEELITDPPFVFCDEPTTGLDSYNAYTVIKTLRKLTIGERSRNIIHESDTDSLEMQFLPQGTYKTMATTIMNTDDDFDNGDDDNNWISNRSILKSNRKGIICSIHQPTSDVFELFTHIILMDDGHIIYQGSTDDACLFFSKLGFSCPRNCNPADFYIKLMADRENGYKFSNIIRDNYEQERLKTCHIEWLSLDDGIIKGQEINKISWTYQVFLLVLRSAVETKRNLRQFVVATSFLMMTSVTLAIAYSSVPGYNQSSVQDIEGSFFMLTTEIIFTNSYQILYYFPSLLPILRREVGENIYKLSAFYVAQILTYIPKAFITSYLFFGLIYTFISFSKGFLVYLSMALTLSLSAICATAYGILLSSIFESERLAAEMAAPFDLFLIIFAGLYYNVNSIPYLKYASMFYFANEALAYEYWNDVNFIACSQNIGQPCLQNGTEVLERYSYETHPGTILNDYIGLIILTCVLHFLAFIGIQRYVKRTGFY